MRIRRIEPPRTFEVGTTGERIEHHADVELEAQEQVTFTSPSGSEYDVVRKPWGYYATPSMNGRLADHGLRAALCVGVPRPGQENARMYVLLVERGRESELEEYMGSEGMRVAAWLDTDRAVAGAAKRLEGESE